MHFRFTTAGESHGPALVAIVEGLPAGVPVTAAFVDAQLARRMQGYGRGARMQIEQDRIEWMGGVRSGETIGSKIEVTNPSGTTSSRMSIVPDGNEVRAHAVSTASHPKTAAGAPTLPLRLPTPAPSPPRWTTPS